MIHCYDYFILLLLVGLNFFLVLIKLIFLWVSMHKGKKQGKFKLVLFYGPWHVSLGQYPPGLRAYSFTPG